MKSYPIQTLQTRNNNKVSETHVIPYIGRDFDGRERPIWVRQNGQDKCLDKWTCRRTSSLQHVTYPADKW